MSYVPDMTGRYTILIKYGGDEIPYSPYRIRALPTGDASKCTVTGTWRTRPLPSTGSSCYHLTTEQKSCCLSRTQPGPGPSPGLDPGSPECSCCVVLLLTSTPPPHLTVLFVTFGSGSCFSPTVSLNRRSRLR